MTVTNIIYLQNTGEFLLQDHWLEACYLSLLLKSVGFIWPLNDNAFLVAFSDVGIIASL